jgi:8-oxo-dGTP pyrophosphatase MutT (NUDIX family)
VKLDPDHIRSRLLRQPACAAIPLSPASQAAVLVLLCRGDSGSDFAEPAIVLTRRSEQLSRHAGQISLPGGRVHHDETSEETALREAAEEVGLDPVNVAVLGTLPVIHVPTSAFDVTPVVGWVNSRPQWQPDPREVAEVIECPARFALDHASYKTGSMVQDGVSREFWYFDFDGHHVWGATARVLRSLALLLAEPDDVQPSLR